MRPSWISNPFRSYLGGTIYHTSNARYNAALRWYRTLMNLGFPVTPEITRLARFIRHGVLNEHEASQVFYSRLPSKLFVRYSLMLYWIDDDWLPESDFYFKLVDWSWLDMEEVAVNTVLFP